jgi:hypothetical protein
MIEKNDAFGGKNPPCFWEKPTCFRAAAMPPLVHQVFTRDEAVFKKKQFEK